MLRIYFILSLFLFCSLSVKSVFANQDPTLIDDLVVERFDNSQETNEVRFQNYSNYLVRYRSVSGFVAEIMPDSELAVPCADNTASSKNNDGTIQVRRNEDFQSLLRPAQCHELIVIK